MIGQRPTYGDRRQHEGPVWPTGRELNAIRAGPGLTSSDESIDIVSGQRTTDLRFNLRTPIAVVYAAGVFTVTISGHILAPEGYAYGSTQALKFPAPASTDHNVMLWRLPWYTPLVAGAGIVWAEASGTPTISTTDADTGKLRMPQANAMSWTAGDRFCVYIGRVVMASDGSYTISPAATASLQPLPPYLAMTPLEWATVSYTAGNPGVLSQQGITGNIAVSTSAGVVYAIGTSKGAALSAFQIGAPTGAKWGVQYATITTRSDGSLSLFTPAQPSYWNWCPRLGYDYTRGGLTQSVTISGTTMTFVNGILTAVS